MQDSTQSSLNRLSAIYIIITVISVIFVLRLFYLQVIRHNYYQNQAQASQLKRYEIAADRGTLLVQDGSETVPLVLNERRYNIVADPEIIEDKGATAQTLASLLGRDVNELKQQLESNTRYEILAKKQPTSVRDRLIELYDAGDIVGVFAEKTTNRVYPQGNTASSFLGFVDDDGKGQYGIEQALNESLNGTPGKVKALTDQNGIPLLASGDNILEDPVDGEDIVLTIDIAMQRQAEKILKEGLAQAQSESGDIIILDPDTGRLKALASYPTYDLAAFDEVSDARIFKNSAVDTPLEPGSVMKPLVAAAALNEGAVGKDQTYYDPSRFTIDDAVVSNIEEDGGAAVRSVSDILRFSLNTGATWLLMQLGGGELNEKGRQTWHEYLVNKYQFGKPTNIEQGYEEPGIVPSPTEGFGLNITYANTSFGQGITTTPLQMASAVASIINGGTYYQPTLVAGTQDSEGALTVKEPVVVNDNVVSDEVSNTMVEFMQTVVAGNSVTRGVMRDGYIVGGKTGTAEIARPEGGYYSDRFNGTYVGFVGGERPEYLIFVRVDEPKIPGYAGSQAAGPIFTSMVSALIDNFSVQASN